MGKTVRVRIGGAKGKGRVAKTGGSRAKQVAAGLAAVPTTTESAPVPVISVRHRAAQRKGKEKEFKVHLLLSSRPAST
jgi:hypothetical protein